MKGRILNYKKWKEINEQEEWDVDKNPGEGEEGLDVEPPMLNSLQAVNLNDVISELKGSEVGEDNTIGDVLEKLKGVIDVAGKNEFKVIDSYYNEFYGNGEDITNELNDKIDEVQLNFKGSIKEYNTIEIDAESGASVDYVLIGLGNNMTLLTYDFIEDASGVGTVGIISMK
jgi:hypothetical protein